MFRALCGSARRARICGRRALVFCITKRQEGEHDDRQEHHGNAITGSFPEAFRKVDADDEAKYEGEGGGTISKMNHQPGRPMMSINTIAL